MLFTPNVGLCWFNDTADHIADFLVLLKVASAHYLLLGLTPPVWDPVDETYPA